MRIQRFHFILFLTSVFLFTTCELVNDEDEEITPVWEFNLEPRLDVDSNGYYHLTLNQQTFQTIHRISVGYYDYDGQLQSEHINIVLE
jgi:hypothetical protein